MMVLFLFQVELVPTLTGTMQLTAMGLSVRKMKEVLFEHRFIPAREAYECGFVSRIYPSREVLEKETLAFADRVAANESPNYIRNIKEALNITMDFAGFSSAMDNASRLSFEQRPKNVGSSVDNQARGTTNVARSSIALTNLKLKQNTDKNYLEK